MVMFNYCAVCHIDVADLSHVHVPTQLDTVYLVEMCTVWREVLHPVWVADQTYLELDIVHRQGNKTQREIRRIWTFILVCSESGWSAARKRILHNNGQLLYVTGTPGHSHQTVNRSSGHAVCHSYRDFNDQSRSVMSSGVSAVNSVHRQLSFDKWRTSDMSAVTALHGCVSDCSSDPSVSVNGWKL